MTKISCICFITLVFMSATLPSYSGESSPSDGNKPCAGNCDPGYYLDTDCQCKSCPANYYCPSQDKKIACLVGETSPIGSDSKDDCVFNCKELASNNNEGKCKETGFCGYYYSGPVFNDDYCKDCNDITQKNDCTNYAGCYWDQNKCTHCPSGYYCKSGSDSKKVCSTGKTSQLASYSDDDCYFDCTLYNAYKNITGLGVEYAQGMCRAASGCYWNVDSCEYCPEGYYCDNTTTKGLEKQKCPFNSTSDPKSTKKSDCYLGSSNKICDSNNVCYKLGNNEKIYYWQTNAEFIQSGTKAQFPEKATCYPHDPLPCS